MRRIDWVSVVDTLCLTLAGLGIAVLLCAVLAGCGVPCHSVDALRGSFNVLGVDYLRYVDADETLDDRQRERRHVHVEEHRALLETLGELCGEAK